MLVEAAYPQWIGELKLTTSRSNWEPIQSRWNVWVRPVIGRRRVGDLTEQQLQAIINKGFAGGLSKKYLSNMCTDLTMFCKWLRLSKMSTLRPEELHVPKGARSKEKEILQPEDLRTLFEVDTTILDGKLIEDPYVNAYRFSVVTGLRPGELIGLSWKDVKGGRVKIRRAINTRGEETRGKNDNAVRAFALTDSAAAILQAQKKLTGGQESVFGISCEDTYRKYWRRYCEANGLQFNYFKPAGDSDAERVAMIESAIDEGYNVVVLPGYAFAGAIKETADIYPEVTFIALDVSAGDLGDDYTLPSNLYCAVYQEELCGYMAGYAAVKLGSAPLGFLGGMAVPAVVRYGFGYVQGVDAAAKELGIRVDLMYAYGNQFVGDADITAAMDTWYQGGTEIVFACGGGIYTSAAEAAAKVGGKIIGVDVDQAGIIDGDYGEGMTVTSAMKGLAPTVKHLLSEVVAGNFANYGGKIETLGLVSANPEENYVQIPTASTQFEDGKFTQADYEALVAAMFAGDVTVSNDITAMPAVTNVTVEDFGNLK